MSDKDKTADAAKASETKEAEKKDSSSSVENKPETDKKDPKENTQKSDALKESQKEAEQKTNDLKPKEQSEKDKTIDTKIDKNPKEDTKPLVTETEKNAGKIVASQPEKSPKEEKSEAKTDLKQAEEMKAPSDAGNDAAKKDNKTPEETVQTENTKTDVEEKLTEETPLSGRPGKFQGVNPRLVFAVLAAALGSAFQHGYNLGVINAPLQLMKDMMVNTTLERTGEILEKEQVTFIVSVLASIYCVGGMIGGSLTGFFSSRYGRKGGLLINNAFAILASIFFGFCKMAASYEMIIVGRLIIGFNNGLNAGLAPMYLSEIAPTNLRGAIGTVYQLVVTISILVSQILGLDYILGSENLWPLLLALTVVPAIFQLFTLPICPESPKYLLVNKEQRLEAQRALTWLRNTSNVHEELEEIQNEAEAQKLVPSVSLREIVMNPALRIPLIISMMMMLAQQFSGINAAIFFSKDIFLQAGLNEEAAMYATIAMGAMNVLMTVISLILVEKAGRKTLMLAGLAGMCVDTILLTICLALSPNYEWIRYASIVLVILFVVLFAVGPGSIPWFLVTELFASNARPTASSIAVAINWTAAFIVSLAFLPLKEAIGPYVFLVFTVLLIIFILFTIRKVPETKGRSIDEITAVFKQQAYGGTGNKV